MTRWGWGLWVLAIAVSFSGFEAWAIYTGTPTLSQTIWAASAAFPLLPFLAGLLAGGLGVHFFWVSKTAGDQDAILSLMAKGETDRLKLMELGVRKKSQDKK